MDDVDLDALDAELAEQEYEIVDVDTLELHPQNPNEGDLGLIIESIKVNKFFGAISAQTSTRHVIAGNHRLIAARQLGLPRVPVIWMDVDDEEAARRMLVDNEAARRGRNNPELLGDLLSGLAMTEMSLLGTGFDKDDLDKLLAEAETPLNLGDATTYKVVVPVQDKATGDSLVEQLRSAGYEAKVESK